MKIIATVSPSKFLVEITETEIANIIGRGYPSEVKEGIRVGQEVKVGDLWRVLNVSRSRHTDLAHMADKLHDLARQIDSVNDVLESPIVDAKA